MGTAPCVDSGTTWHTICGVMHTAYVIVGDRLGGADGDDDVGERDGGVLGASDEGPEDGEVVGRAVVQPAWQAFSSIAGTHTAGSVVHDCVVVTVGCSVELYDALTTLTCVVPTGRPRQRWCPGGLEPP